MTNVTVTTRIDAPLDVVFRRCSDIEHGSARVSGIHQIDMLTPGPIRVGTRWIETRLVLGRADSAEMAVTAFQRNRMFTIRHHKAGVQIDATFWFEPKEGATVVTIEFEAEGGMLPPSLLRPLGWALQRKIERVLAHDLADTKRAIERTDSATSRPS
jgi:polyketide cyclase/dehydrase/lipid transport protein